MAHTDGGGVVCCVRFRVCRMWVWCLAVLRATGSCVTLSHTHVGSHAATAVFATTLTKHGQQKRNLALCLKKRKSMADLRIGSIGGFGDDGITQESRPPASMEWANAKVEARVNEFWHLVEKKLHAAQAVQ